MLFFIIKSWQIYKISFSYQYMYKQNRRDSKQKSQIPEKKYINWQLYIDTDDMLA